MSFFDKFFEKPEESKKEKPQEINFVDGAISWSQIDESLRLIENSLERDEFENISKGRGKSNHKANIRLFDAPDDFEPEVTLYRDSAGWCPYCEKVWLQLEEKRIPYVVQKVNMRCYGDKPKSFFSLNPSGGIPVAIVRGKVIKESNDIMNLIEREFSSTSHPPLYPPEGSPAAARVPALFKLERRLFSTWFNWLISNGEAAAAEDMHKLFTQVETELGISGGEGGPYFLGTDISIVDIMFTPFLERMAASLPYFKGFECRSPKYPNLLRWFEAMDSRPSYQGVKSDYYTHCHDLPPQIGSCYFRAESKRFREEIDGGAWDLSRLSASLIEPMLPVSEAVACREAVRALVSNHVNIVKFAMRAVGERGNPPVSASLSDPYAVPDESYKPYVDSALRHVAHSLLRGGDPNESAPCAERVDSLAEALTRTVWGDSNSADAPLSQRQWPTRQTSECLRYFRDRVGVPRDLSVHAARMLRSHLNLMISVLNSR